MVKWWVFGLVVLLVGFGGYLALYSPLGLQQRAVFPAPKEPNPPIGGLVPGAADVTLKSADGESVRTYYLKAPGSSPTLLYFHGNGVTIGDQIDVFKRWRSAGFGVLAVEYRGYADSPGLASETNTYGDALSAYQFLQAQGVPAERIVAVGWSLGSTVAAQLASTQKLAAAVLLAPFTSMSEMAALRYPGLPFDRILTYRLDTRNYVTNLACPLLLVHGTADLTVPYAMTEALYQVATAPRRLMRLEGAGHADVFGPEVLAAIRKLTRG